jgi:hypothetical protein
MGALLRVLLRSLGEEISVREGDTKENTYFTKIEELFL